MTQDPRTTRLINLYALTALWEKAAAEYILAVHDANPKPLMSSKPKPGEGTNALVKWWSFFVSNVLGPIAPDVGAIGTLARTMDEMRRTDVPSNR